MEKKIEMFQALMKTQSGEYVAVLSDNSLDRDGEIVGTSALSKVHKEQNGKIPILLNHENKIENLVGEWVNRRMETRDGHSAFVANPKFYLSNPKAKMIKGLLDDGAECGISIGAIVKNSEVQKINNQDVTVYTDIELLEASFVAIPSNRHGAAMAVAKNFKNKLEVSKMDDTMKKDFEDKIETLDKTIVDRDAKIAELTKEVEDAKIDAEKVKTEIEEKEASFNKSIEELNKRIVSLEKKPVDKGMLDTEEVEAKKLADAELIKTAIEKGYMPILRG